MTNHHISELQINLRNYHNDPLHFVETRPDADKGKRVPVLSQTYKNGDALDDRSQLQVSIV